jgi:4-amino-4-deoxy-L-arabinose transferase-like glycosyltransferase
MRWWPLLTVAGIMSAVQVAFSWGQGYHLDELYTRVASQHLALSQIDQPPMVAVVARIETILFGDNLMALRVVPALIAGVLVLLSALIARELGGSRRAQMFAAVGGAVSGLVIQAGHLLGTNNFDILAWVLVCWLAIRLARTGNTKLWLTIGVVVGLGLHAKYLIGLLLICLAIGVLVAGPRSALRSWHLAAGAGIALVIASPVLIWQAANGWPQFEMADALSIALGDLARTSFLPIEIVIIGLFLTPIWIAGLVTLLRRKEWRPFRFVGVAYLVMIVLLLVVAGQATYTGALQYVLLAAGCVAAEGWARNGFRKTLIGAAAVLNAAMSMVLALPVMPIQVYADNPVLQQLAIVQLDQSGWPELTAQAANIYKSLPPADQQKAIFYGNHYGQAGALDKYGPDYGLPQAYSGHNSYADFAQPTDDKTVVITIGVDKAKFSTLFQSCEPRGSFEINLPVSDKGQEFMVCRNPVESWSQIWPKLRWIGFQCPFTATAITAKSTAPCPE